MVGGEDKGEIKYDFQIPVLSSMRIIYTIDPIIKNQTVVHSVTGEMVGSVWTY